MKSTTTYITLSHVTIRNKLAEQKLVMSQILLIEDCEFSKDTLIDGEFSYIEYINLLTDRMINEIPKQE